MPLTSASRVVSQAVSYLWPEQIPLGKLLMMDGDPDLGKSLIALDLCARLSTGRPFPDGQAGPGPANALVLSAEDSAADTIVPRLRRLGADTERVFVWQREREDEDWPWRFPADIDRLDEALGRSDARLAVLDPIMSFLDSSVVCASDQSVRRVLGLLQDLAEKHRCALMMQRHLNKQGGGRALYRGLGSIGFVALCRFAMLVARDPQTPGQCVLAQVRNSLGPRQPSLAYRLNSSGDGGRPAVEWLGTSPFSADELLGGRPRRERPRDRALDFLEQFLANGPRSSRELWQAAQKAGLSARTLNRAKRRLGIRCRRVHENGQPVSYWLLHGQELPAASPGTRSLTVTLPRWKRSSRRRRPWTRTTARGNWTDTGAQRLLALGWPGKSKRNHIMSALPSELPRAVRLMRSLGMEPDPWQLEVLTSRHTRMLLNCARQAGKSTTVAILGLAEALWLPGTQVLLLSRSHRQSTELFRIVRDYFARVGSPLERRNTVHELHLVNHSSVVCLPCREDTIRGYSKVSLLVIDEAARVPDDLYRAVRPMLAVSGGRLVCLSTPYGKRGFFYEAWAGKEDWLRVEVPATRIPRIPPEFLEEERRALGESWFRQEYLCSFEALEGLVYPDFARCVVPAMPAGLGGRQVGGIDFGFRNPFAAVWGVLDRDDVLWLTGEHYVRGQPLSHHAKKLPRSVEWYCDPAGAGDRCELRYAHFCVREGNNAVRLGIAAVMARLGDGRLRVVAGRCPNLLAEAQLYRYGEQEGAETPLAEHNHALDALRYLVATLDAHRLARQGRADAEAPAAEETAAKPLRWAQREPWRSFNNPDLWNMRWFFDG